MKLTVWGQYLTSDERMVGIHQSGDDSWLSSIRGWLTGIGEERMVGSHQSGEDGWQSSIREDGCQSSIRTVCGKSIRIEQLAVINQFSHLTQPIQSKKNNACVSDFALLDYLEWRTRDLALYF